MAIYYKVYQNNRKDSPTKGKWYGRAAMLETDTTDDLAKAIQEKCTVNEADVLAVIKSLISEMTRSLQNSHRVKLPGFGTFKLGLRTKPADERDKFGVANIKDVHVLFSPELKREQNGTRTRTFINGARVKAFSSLAAEKGENTSDENAGDNAGDNAGSGSGSGGNTSAGGTNA